MTELRTAIEEAVEAVVKMARRTPRGARDAHGRAGCRPALAREAARSPTAWPDVVEELIATATPGLMASAGPRYYGFVTGGTLDAALVAEILAVGWDQCAYNEAMSPAAIAFEDVAGGWLKDLLGLPSTASVGFTTGGQGANTVGLAAARWHVLDAGRLGRREQTGSRRCAAGAAGRRGGAPRHDRPLTAPARLRHGRDGTASAHEANGAMGHLRAAPDA